MYIVGKYAPDGICLGVLLLATALSVSETDAQVVAYRVNAGGTATAAGDASYPDWSADEKGAPSPYVNANVAGDETSSADKVIDLTSVTDPSVIEALFRTQRLDLNPPVDNLTYSFPVTNGREYKVVLYFAELFENDVDVREFDVFIEGVLEFDNVDIFEETGGTAAPDLFSDTFGSTQLDPRWRFFDPVGDVNLVLTGTNANMVIPDGVDHDLWRATQNNAPRLLQQAPNASFGTEVKFESTLENDAQIQGLIAQEDDDTFIRMDVYSDGTSLFLFAAFVDGGTTATYLNTIVSEEVVPDFLRMERTGDQWSFQYSEDGSNWTEAANFEQPMTVTEVGFFGGTARDNPAFTVSADYFMDLANPVVDTDGELVLAQISSVLNTQPTALVKEKTLTAQDDMLEITFENLTQAPAVISAIEIIDTASLNQAPLVTVPGTQTNNAGEMVELQIQATDPDAINEEALNGLNGLTYTAESLPDGLQIDVMTGLISGTIAADAAGMYMPRITVVDDGIPNAGTIISFEWNVFNQPIVENPIEDVVVSAGSPDLEIVLTEVFTDPGGFDLTFSVEGNTNTQVVTATMDAITGNTLVLSFSPDMTGSSVVTVRAENELEFFVDDEFNVTVDEAPSASIKVTPTGTLGESTFNGGSLSVENLSGGGTQISTVTFDLTNSLFLDMVFDPTGAAGDQGALCLNPDGGATETGFIAPNDPCVDPFSVPKDGGFLQMTFSFNDFDPSETFTFSVDVDPTSIQGNQGVGDAGSVGGVEMIGSAITVAFSNETVVTNDLFYLLESDGGAEAIVTETPLEAPTIELEGAPEVEAQSVTGFQQNILVTGPVGAQVRLFQIDGRLNLEGSNGFDIDPFEANEAIGVVDTYTETIGADGTVLIPVTLDRSFFGGAFTGGLNHFMAALEGTFFGRTSNRLVLELENFSTVSFVEGWNLIGLSNNVADNNYLTLYSGVNPELAPFEWNGSLYIETETIETGTGYWLKAGTAGSIGISGTEFSEVSVDVAEGWNMIAGPSCVLNVEDILDPNNVILPGTFFSYMGSYQDATALNPSFGYWVKTSAAGTITLDCNVLTKKEKERINWDEVLASFGAVTIRDQGAFEQTLHFGGSLEEGMTLANFAMPPVGPSGFDARFIQDTRLIETETGVIQLSSDAFPLELTLDAVPTFGEGRYTLETLAGDRVVKSFELGVGESFAISNPDVQAVRIKDSSTADEALPEQFALTGNYPNPFNPTTTIVFDLPEDASVRVEVYDLLGRQVMAINPVEMLAGANKQVQLDASSLASGTYVYRVHTVSMQGEAVQAGRMTLLK